MPGVPKLLLVSVCMSLLLFVGVGCAGKSSAQSDAPPSQSAAKKAPSGSRSADVNVQQLHEARDLDASWLLVDVRSPREFESGHIPGAVNVPLGELKSRQAELEAGRGGLYVVCQSGGRSAKATKQLAGWGFGQVTNVAGGTGAWIAAGYPTETKP
jgi:rhodanese-related sulfurtransferase